MTVRKIEKLDLSKAPEETKELAEKCKTALLKAQNAEKQFHYWDKERARSRSELAQAEKILLSDLDRLEILKSRNKKKGVE